VKIISFEGIEGVGKSTQIELLKKLLEKNSKSVEVFREPGSTLSGEKIRDILLDNKYELSSKTELLLMFSARSELVNKKINNSTADYLLLDRFFDASLAYQGYGRNLSIELINKLVDFIDCPIPDLSFLIDISVEEGFARKINDKIDRIESSGNDFFNKVRNGYIEIAKNNEDRFIIINGSKTVDEIHNNIIQNIDI
tara:strand:+ start:934 stop:1524 length:591 start_codon:yes stop_codon:yes gene_type:complete